jgi:peptide/nickel transport system substrate-binding protein
MFVVVMVVALLAMVACAKGAAPTATPLQKSGSEPSGELVIGVTTVPPLVALQSKDAAGTVGSFGCYWNIFEGIIAAKLTPIGELSPVDEYVSRLAESWETASDGTSITFKIREGIPWHKTDHGDFGNVTAEDVVWTFNNSFEEGSTGNAGEQLPVPHKKGWEVVDEYTARMNITDGKIDPTWGVLHGSMFDAAFGIVSKKAYDELGEDEFITAAIGTGPFKATHWRGHDEVLAEAVENHWRITPGVKTLRIVEMTEQSTREAALRTGEVDIATLPGKILGDVVEDTGAGVIEVGIPNPNSVYMSGNYWGATCETCPETDVYRKWPGFLEAIEKGLPWVGDPDDAAQMERARKVRWAMSMAIDRETVVETVAGGYSEPVYIHLHAQFPRGSEHWKEDWYVPYDPAKAKEWLAEAGYADGFDVEYWSAPDYVFWDPEYADMVAEMWRKNLGLNVSVDHSPYASRRPTTVDKTINVPWHHGWDVPPGTAKANFFCPQPGHTGGVSLPDDICETGYKSEVEPDLQKRLQYNSEMQDYMSHWQLQIGVATVGNYWVYLPHVKGWHPYMIQQGYFSNPETITLDK